MPLLEEIFYDGWTYKIWWQPLAEPTGLEVIGYSMGGGDAAICWVDPADSKTIPQMTWVNSKLIRKAGSAPTAPDDWDEVVVETVRNSYSYSPCQDSWMTPWTTYYYRVFVLASSSIYSYGDAISFIPPYNVAWLVSKATTEWNPWTDTIAELNRIDSYRGFFADKCYQDPNNTDIYVFQPLDVYDSDSSNYYYIWYDTTNQEWIFHTSISSPSDIDSNKKSTAEIIAMGNTEGYPWDNTRIELNRWPSDYYTQLSNDSALATSQVEPWEYIFAITDSSHLNSGIICNSLIPVRYNWTISHN